MHSADLGLTGVLRGWERPDGMTLDEFLAAPPEELGDPAIEVENIVVNGWYVDILSSMTGIAAAPSLQVLVLAVGTGSLGGGAARRDAAMVNEWHRYAVISSLVNTSDPPAATLSFFLPAGDGAVTLTEAGLFHAGATLTPASGRMTSHVAFAYSKASNLDLRVDYTLTRSLT